MGKFLEVIPLNTLISYNLFPQENWRQVQTPLGITFNMIDATSTCVWGVDFEYQVYLFVKECDLPIRFQVHDTG